MVSTPTRPATLQFVIRCCGDWTRDIGRLKTGDPVAVDGPFGLFSHLVRPYTKELVMIAGGIGITPMLSMLRYLGDIGDERKILLIWSNQTGKDVILPAEFLDIQSRLTNLRLKRIFTRDPEGGKENGRLNQAGLKELLTDFSKQAVFFICGPRPMMHDIRQALAYLGYLRRKIHLEEFRL
jgi:ferredoxin-NADP reductase